ncbi:MAG: hypothetical protein C0597_09230 [Marinilabiliales bacterium]|nr:MAG: hypothetical protein C0597_09230 [Marinilabiliales bacterium]
MRSLIIFFFLTLFCFYSYSQEESHKSQGIIFLPEERIFSLINLDPLSCQIYGGMYIILEDGEKNKGIFIPVNLGFSKPFFGLYLSDIKFEIGLEAGSYTQFEIVHVENTTYLGGLFNNDYKASAYLSSYYKNISYRLRLFHISSYLGDDYMIRNEEFIRNDKSVNYEQLDLTVLKKINYSELYTGIGYILTPNAYRERLSFQIGFQFEKTGEKIFQLVGGVDLKAFEQNSFYPNIRTAIGTKITTNKRKAGLRIQMEYYHGHLPYSTQEYRKISWFGISSSIAI